MSLSRLVILGSSVNTDPDSPCSVVNRYPQHGRQLVITGIPTRNVNEEVVPMNLRTDSYVVVLLLCPSECGRPHRLVRVTTFRCPETSVSCILLGTLPNFRWAPENRLAGLVNILLPAVVVSAVLLSTNYLRGEARVGVAWHLATDLKKLLTWNMLLCWPVFRVCGATGEGVLRLAVTVEAPAENIVRFRVLTSKLWGSVLQLVRSRLFTVVQLLLESYK